MCWLSYPTQAVIIAWIEVVTSAFGFFFVSTATFILEYSEDIKKRLLDADETNILNNILHFSMPEKVTSVVIPIIYFFGEFLLAFFLLRSITYRNYKHIKVWYIVTITIAMSYAYFFLPGVFLTDDNTYFIFAFVGSYAFTAYSVWVVYNLMQEMKREGLHRPVLMYEDDEMKL